ncbi:MAG: PEP-utilizing enzyme [Candidatus Paceibacterota bacterium]|jgi:phosphoenolpyruvate synthase/pyruvate phosphate dikinase
MDRWKFKKEDFFLTGSAESAPLFYYSCSIGVILVTKALLVVINNNGVSRWFIEKRASEGLMKYWVSVSKEFVTKRFISWKEKWQKKENYLFNITNKPIKDWKEMWKEVDTLAAEFWMESYFVESLDPFAEEIDKQISEELEKVGIDKEHIHGLIATIEPTRTQKAAIDFELVLQGKMTKQEYIKKYWYYKGSWIGGEVLTEKMLGADFLPKPVPTDYLKREAEQQMLLPKLSEKTQNLIHLLQIFTLWREERKVYMQMMSVCYSTIIHEASKTEGVSYNDLIWARPEEIELLKKDNDFILKRKRQSVFLISPQYNPPKLLTEDNALEVIEGMTSKDKNKIAKGTVACKGVVQGIAKIVLKEHQFGKFQKGEILITTSTRPEFLPIMSLASAIVTDEGGLTSHAAIISRELKRPCIVGTKHATSIFEDGDLIEVDADKGVVKIIK